jgi:hypothetical protein
LIGHSKNQGKDDSNSRTNSLHPEEDDAGQFTTRPIILNWPYLEISRSDEDNLDRVGKLTQRATNSYFIKISNINIY